jgi:hypothetical protein
MEAKLTTRSYFSSIRSGEDTRTTLMIKNIPNKYERLCLSNACLLLTINNVTFFSFHLIPEIFINCSFTCRYTSKMLLAAIDENHKGTYDFLYLPIDFKVYVMLF